MHTVPRASETQFLASITSALCAHTSVPGSEYHYQFYIVRCSLCTVRSLPAFNGVAAQPCTLHNSTQAPDLTALYGTSFELNMSTALAMFHFLNFDDVQSAVG